MCPCNVYVLSFCCSEVLRKYADCKLGSQVIAVQDFWLKQCQSERHQQPDLPPTTSSDDSEDENIEDVMT